MPALEPAPTAENILLKQSRVIRAPRSRVYEAWTNPEILKRWFGPASMHCPSTAMDVRVGGAYRIDVISDGPIPSADGAECAQRTSAAVGNYTKIVPNELLQFTWAPDWNPGEQSLVTVSLRDVAEGTEVTILHERFASEISRDGHKRGWADCLTKLEALLSD